MTNFYIYKITNIINNKIYIGKSKGNNNKRWKIHLCISAGGKEKYPRLFFAIHAAIKKYGSENFRFEILQNTDNEDHAFILEKYWISFLRKLILCTT